MTHTMHQLRSNPDTGTTRYWYRGWILRKDVRDWDARGLGGNGWAGPKVAWIAKKQYAPKHTEQTFNTRREATGFVDEQEGTG